MNTRFNINYMRLFSILTFKKSCVLVINSTSVMDVQLALTEKQLRSAKHTLKLSQFQMIFPSNNSNKSNKKYNKRIIFT